MKRTLMAILIALSAVLPGRAADEKGFVLLFDGKTLDGWKKHGGMATYKIEDNCVVGSVGPGPNTFLCTEKNYGNFRLEVESILDVPSNSGIQFRSHIREKDDRVFGYQCEIDPSDRAWSAGIYDEGRRGWLNPLSGDDDYKKKARTAYKKGEWNKFVIETRGPWLRTWLNDIPCADLLDASDLDGLIALQVHAAKEGRIRWRNVRIKEFAPSKWEPIFDGKTLEGWKKQGGDWSVKDGVIVGKAGKSEAKSGHLVSDKEYGDFAVRLKYKAMTGNSGLNFRAEEGDKNLQAEIDPVNDVGGLLEAEGRGWIVQPKPEDVKKWIKANDWNELVVIAMGDRVVVQVNGNTSAEIKKDVGRAKGRLALELHGGQDVEVQFKDIEVQEIPKVD
jgi:hypothetical protein